MTVEELVKRLSYYNPKAKLSLAISPLQRVEILSIYSKKESVKDKVVYIDVGNE